MSEPDVVAELSIAALLGRWPDTASVARDLGLSYFTVAAWLRRDSIPVEYWDTLTQAARARRLRGVTFARLRTIAARKRNKYVRTHIVNKTQDSDESFCNRTTTPDTATVQDALSPRTPKPAPASQRKSTYAT